MIANESCWNCCLSTAQRRAKALPVQPEQLDKMLEEIRTAADDCHGCESAPAMSAILTEVMKKYADVDDQYILPKRSFNELMLHLEPRIDAEILSDSDPLRRALQFAMAGNYIDFGALDVVTEDKLMEILGRSSQIAVNSAILSQLREDLRTKKTLLYITDNCGEIVMDKLLLRLIQKQYPNLDITILVRGMPTHNDATVSDAAFVGLTDIAPVIGNGTCAPGTPLDGRLVVPEDIRARVYSADICIAKGQGNFESLHGCGLNIYYMFLCKCTAFVERFGMEQFAGVLANEKNVMISQ